jgi:AAA family ATP:ADP antiporter
MSTWIGKIREFFAQFTLGERMFIFAAMVCSYLISAEYAIVRPVSNSVFIASYGAKLLPWAWVFSIPLNLLVLSLYNRCLGRMKCFPFFVLVACSVVCVNAISSILLSAFSIVPFLFYIWKDIYVMLMFQLLWSVIHTTTHLSRARYLYGLLFGVGALGGLTGSVVAGSFAVSVGSERLLLFTLPIYAALVMAYKVLVKNSALVRLDVANEIKQTSSIKESISLVMGSKLLFAILLMVAFMQNTATLTDFQFNNYLEKLYPEKDLRTQYFGRLLAFGNILTMSFQFVGVYALIKMMGKFKTHLMIPLVLAVNCFSFIAFPAFGVISYAFLTIKCFDFSLFNVVKEMLYIPLKTQEKFRAKAVIDVFMYRGAKVFAFFVVMIMQIFLADSVVAAISWVNLALLVTWCFVVYSIRSYYQDKEITPIAVQE